MVKSGKIYLKIYWYDWSVTEGTSGKPDIYIGICELVYIQQID